MEDYIIYSHLKHLLVLARCTQQEGKTKLKKEREIMFKKTFTIAAIMSLFAMSTPALVLASRGEDDTHNDDRGRIEMNDDSRREDRQEDRREDRRDDRHDGEDDKGLHHGFYQGLFYNGVVTAVSSTGFTITSSNNATLTVNTESAKIIQIPRAVITLGDIAVGDRVHVTGTKVDSVVTASVVYSMPMNSKFAKEKGTVTAVTDTTVTIQNKSGETVTVNTDADTQVVDQNGDATTLAEVDTGEKVKVFGIWDTVLNIFNAIKIRLK